MTRKVISNTILEFYDFGDLGRYGIGKMVEDDDVGRHIEYQVWRNGSRAGVSWGTIVGARQCLWRVILEKLGTAITKTEHLLFKQRALETFLKDDDMGIFKYREWDHKPLTGA